MITYVFVKMIKKFLIYQENLVVRNVGKLKVSP